MADRKLVMLKEGQTLFKAKETIDKLAPYVKHPNPTTVLVIVFKGGVLTATSKIMKAAAESQAVVLNSQAVRDYQMTAHIKDFCLSNKISLEEKAMNLMIDYIGLPLSKFFGELNKLISIKKSQNPGAANISITSEDVEQNIGISKDFNNFELTKAMAYKDYPKCVKIITYFEKNPKANPGVLVGAAIAGFFTRLILAHYSDKTDYTLQQLIGYPNQNAVMELKESMRNYSAMQAVKGLHAVREFDAKSKGIGSMQNEYQLLKDLIFKIFTC